MERSTDHRHRRSPSSDRFLDIFSFSPPSTTTLGGSSGGDELNEAEILWIDEFTESNHQQVKTVIDSRHQTRRSNFTRPESSGILAALPEATLDGPVLTRKNSISSPSSSRMIPSIPRPPPEIGPNREYSQSLNSRKYQQSAPMNVPMLSRAMARERSREFVEINDDNDDYEMLPPHEIAARGSGVSPQTTFSVLEGVGRTLKGRDLRQVRNAIWRKTGFLD